MRQPRRRGALSARNHLGQPQRLAEYLQRRGPHIIQGNLIDRRQRYNALGNRLAGVFLGTALLPTLSAPRWYPTSSPSTQMGRLAQRQRNAELCPIQFEPFQRRVGSTLWAARKSPAVGVTANDEGDPTPDRTTAKFSAHHFIHHAALRRQSTQGSTRRPASNSHRGLLQPFVATRPARRGRKVSRWGPPVTMNDLVTGLVHLISRPVPSRPLHHRHGNRTHLPTPRVLAVRRRRRLDLHR